MGGLPAISEGSIPSHGGILSSLERPKLTHSRWRQWWSETEVINEEKSIERKENMNAPAITDCHQGPAAPTPESGSAFALRRVGYVFPLPCHYLSMAEAESARNMHIYYQARELEIVTMKFKVVTPNAELSARRGAGSDQ